MGLALEEVSFGLRASALLGDWILNPFFLRLPFAAAGVLSVLLLFQTLRKLGKDFWFSYTAAFFLAVLPWHIQISRSYSLGVLILAAALFFVVLFAKQLVSSFEKVGKIALLLSIFIFLLSILFIPENLRQTVDEERAAVVTTETVFPIRIFSNKYIASYRYRESFIFENLDFGNFFFRGYPRERWGVEEIQKLYLVMLPLLILGFLKLERKLGWLLLTWSALAFSLLAFFEERGPGASLPIIFPLILLTTNGGIFLFNRMKRTKWLVFLLVTLLFLESGSFIKGYFAAFPESLFSPRRAVYQRLVPEVEKLAQTKEQVLVSTRLGDPALFFEFYTKSSFAYLKGDLAQKFEFREFNIWEEEDRYNKLFIDVLPDEPSPSEPLYQEGGRWPQPIKVLTELYDKGRRQTVLVYEYQ